GSLNVSLLVASLNAIVRRHESLRTTFREIDGRPVQVIAPTLEVEALVIDLSALAQERRETRARELAAVEAARPFDLRRGPLVRAQLLRLTPREHVAVFTLHHIISDGWSLGLLVRELSAWYAALAGGSPAPLPELPIQYADFAVWQRRWLAGEVLDQELAWWRQELAASPQVLDLPTDRPRPPVQSFRGRSEPVQLAPELTLALQELARRQGATVFMTLAAAFQVLLSRYAGQEEFLLGTPIANRNHAEIEELIGLFVNTL
ncbi:MAG: non-ribosomal peptide synthetase, partial [bacterium]|nr:non-ribosomal peptide synthetase [bacterium]